MQATLDSGSPIMVDYTPGSAVSAGDVVVFDNCVRIAHDDIAASRLGALGAANGVYNVAKDSSNFSTAGGDVFWNATGNPVGGTAGSGAATTTNTGVWIGKCVSTAGTTAPTVKAIHTITPEADLVSA